MKLFSKITILSFILFTAHANGKMLCDGPESIDIGYGLTANQQSKLSKDLRPSKQKKMSHKQKVAQVEKTIRRKHKGAGGYSTKQLAETIVWAADCTGNDLKWSATIIGHESNFCSKRINPIGSDSGCGQFTTPALNELRHQFRVSNAKGQGSKGTHKILHNMVKKCYASYKGWVDGSAGKGSYKKYLAILNSPIGSFKYFQKTKKFRKGSIKETLMGARAVHFDILSSAILLKFYASLAGGYSIPGNKPGGVSRYNGGGTKGYFGKVQKEASLLKVNNTYTCVEDTYTDEVAHKACDLEIGESYDSCVEDYEYSINPGVSI